MRVALLLSGKFRSSYIAFNSLENYLLKNYNVDTFISYNYKNENEIEIEKDELISLYKPKKIKFDKYPNSIEEDIKSVENYKKAIESTTSNIFYMWYGILEANNLKVEYENENGFKYDIVIRTRFDIEFLDNINLKFWKNSLFIPMGSDHRDGLNDFMAYGSSNCMDYYCSTFNNLVRYIKDGELIHPERLLKRHIKGLNDCHILRTYIPMKLRGKFVNFLDYSIVP